MLAWSPSAWEGPRKEPAMKYCKACKLPAKDHETKCSRCGRALDVFGVAPPSSGPATPPVPQPGPEQGEPERTDPTAVLIPTGGGRALQLVLGTAGLAVLGVLWLGWMALRPGAPTPLKVSDARPADEPKAAPRASAEPKTASHARLAITRGAFDDVGRLLDSLGPGYRYEEIGDAMLRDPAALGKFDALFLTCDRPDASGESPETAALAKSLRDFVGLGGTLYASDLRYDVVAAAFPERVDRASVAQGRQQSVAIQIVADDLRAIVGPRLRLAFPLEGWRPAAFRGDGLEVLFEGTLKTTASLDLKAPLAVLFPYGQGTVVFTSFHHKEKLGEAQRKLLLYLVRRTATAKMEGRLADRLANDGLTLAQKHAFDLRPGARATGIVPNARTGALRIALASDEPGAILRLELTAPNGKTTVKTGGSVLAIDLPDAAPGPWRYTATADSGPASIGPALMVVGVPGPGDRARLRASNPSLKTDSTNVSFEEVSLGNANSEQTRRPPKIAVSPPSFDDMGKLLDRLGGGFRFTTLNINAMRTPGALNPYDIVFLTCGGWPGQWGTVTGGNFRPGLGQGELRPKIVANIARTIREFVQRGGTLYVSDLRYSDLLSAFPDRTPLRKINENLLPKIIECERQWLQAYVPLAEIGTVADELRKARPSPDVLRDIDQIAINIESTYLVKLKISQNLARAKNLVREIVKNTSKEATEGDIETTFNTLLNWEKSILQAFHARKRSKVAKNARRIISLEQRLTQLRNQIVERPDGKGGQTVQAEVLDQGLRELLGRSVLPLQFKDEAWDPANFSGDDVKVLLQGTYTNIQGIPIKAPLLVKFSEGQGKVIFTSFHNEAQNSQEEEVLLRYLVFSVVNAKAEAIADNVMLSGGFSPVKRNQINHVAGQPSATKTYWSDSSDPLRFALSFMGEGARLRLILVAPGGQKFTKEVESSIVIQASGAPAGEWAYTVEMVKVPYENFPFSVSIGRAKPGNRR